MRSLIDHLARRAAELDLRVGGLEASTLIELTAFGTAVVMNHRYTHTLAERRNDRAPAAAAHMKIVAAPHRGCTRAAGRSGPRSADRRVTRARPRGRHAVVDREVAAARDAACRGSSPTSSSTSPSRSAGRARWNRTSTALLNLLGLRYTGSSPAGLLLAGDKSLTKKIFSFHGIQTPEFATLYRGAVDWAGDLAFPVIVKPPQEDASSGITSASVVHEIKDLFARIGELQSSIRPRARRTVHRGARVLCRRTRQRECGGAADHRIGLSPDFRPTGRASRAGRRSGARTARAAAPSSRARSRSSHRHWIPISKHECKKMAIESFHALRLRDYARIDLRVTDRARST